MFTAEFHHLPEDGASPYDDSHYLVCKIHDSYRPGLVFTGTPSVKISGNVFRIGEIKTVRLPLEEIRIGDAFIPLIRRSEEIHQLGLRYVETFGSAANSYAEQYRLLGQSYTDASLYRYLQHIKWGPRLLDVGVFGMMKAFCGSTEIDPTWYTPDGLWASSEYEYLGREMMGSS